MDWGQTYIVCASREGSDEIASTHKFIWVKSGQQQVFIYSRPIAGIRAKTEHETTYLQTSKWHVKIIFMHLGFKLHIDQNSVRNIGETLKAIYFNSCPGCPKEPSPRRRLLWASMTFFHS